MDETDLTSTKAPDDSKTRTGSAAADSGQSSSADTSSSRGSSSSRSDSIADSLDDQHRAATVAATTGVKSYLSGEAKERNEPEELTNNNNLATPIEQDISGEQPAMKQPLKSALANNNNNNIASNLNKQQVNNNLEAQKKNVISTSNNFSGLNLNMTASEMRELLARRKKFDPKKAQMNIRQKYDIIQQM